MTRLLKVILTLGLMIINGCAKNPFKASQTSKRKVIEEAPERFSDDFLQNMECTSSGKTEAKLLTKEVVNGAAESELRYEISLTDCDGNPKALEAKFLLFDFDGLLIRSAITDRDRGSSFSYTTDGSSIGDGTLERKMGQDLFGRVDPQYAHWRALGDFDLAKNKAVFNINISISERVMLPDSDEIFGYEAAKPEDIDDEYEVVTYLRIGRSLPSKVKVTFKNEDKELIAATTKLIVPDSDDSADTGAEPEDSTEE